MCSALASTAEPTAHPECAGALDRVDEIDVVPFEPTQVDRLLQLGVEPFEDRSRTAPHVQAPQDAEGQAVERRPRHIAATGAFLADETAVLQHRQ